MKRNFLSACAIAACALTLSSCSSEVLGRYDRNSRISVEVSSSTIDTKSLTSETNESPKERLIIDGKVSEQFVLEQTSSDYDRNPLYAKISTKGYNASGLNFSGRHSDFILDAFVPAGSELSDEAKEQFSDKTDYIEYFKDVKAKNSGNAANGDWNLESTYYWINEIPMTFWAIAPATLSGLTKTYSSDHETLYFSYSNPTPSSDFSDAKSQTDVLYTTRTETYDEDTNNDGILDLTFSHALSAVAISMSEELHTAEFQINKVTFTNLAKKGTFIASSSSLECEASDTTTFSQTFNTSDFTQKTSGTTYTTENGELLFMMIPQTLDDNAKIIIEYTTKEGLTGKVQASIAKNKNSENVVWSAGKIYTYNLRTMTSDVEVEVTDNVDGNVKSNLAVTNTGDVKAYIRVMLVGNWMNSNSMIYSAWDASEGAFSGLNADSKWVKGTDGFWYAVDPVEPGASAPALFDTYTAPVKAGLHLNLVVAAQAVPYSAISGSETSYVSSIWGTDSDTIAKLNK